MQSPVHNNYPCSPVQSLNTHMRRRLDEVSIFNERLTFLIPHEWIEGDSGDDGTYLYQLPDACSGWFRVSLVTTKGISDPAKQLRKLFGDDSNVEQSEEMGNLLRRSEKDTVEDGDKLHIYYWFVGGCVLPDMVWEAVFSYTVLKELLHSGETQSEVTLLDELVRKARFNVTQ